MTLSNIINLNDISRRAKLFIFALAAGIMVPIAGFTSTAHAAYSCSSPYVCIYDRTNGEGTAWPFAGARGYCLNIPTYANDKADSYYNRSPYYVVFYKDANCTGDNLILGNGSVAPGARGNFPAICEDQPRSCRNMLTAIRFL